MATVVFCIFNFQGELNGSLKLAKQLKGLGHQVYYLGLADSRNKVQAHGFEFLTILEDWFPVNFFTQLDFDSTKKLNVLNQIFFVKILKRFVYSLIQENNQEVHIALKKINPDFLMISTTESAYATFIAIIAHECKISSMFLTDMFSYLPTHKFSQSRDSKLSQSKALSFSLGREPIKDLFLEFYKRVQKKINCFLNLDLNYKEAILRLATKAQISPDRIDLEKDVPLKLPHLFLCPQELEFPGILREDCYYAEASIDLLREEKNCFNWSKLNQDKKIIYCSLGTTSGTYEALGVDKVLNFFRVLIDSVSSSFYKNEYQLVMVVSNFVKTKLLGSIPDNVFISNTIPQLAILEKSHLAIIAGGIHTIKECIFFGVPMIVFPIWADQFDNADRIKHHKLGLISDIDDISATLMSNLIDEVENISFRQNLETWEHKFREIETSDRAVNFILSTLSSSKAVV